MSDPTKVNRLLKLGERVLSDSTHIFEDHDNAQEAADLLAFCLTGSTEDADDLEADLDVPKRVRERYLSLVARRAGGEPLPFLTGSISFWDLDLKVKPGAFVPRPSSELTVEWAGRRLKKFKNPVVVDVCAGAGPIALAVANDFPDSDVWALDLLEEGLVQGRANAKRLGIKNVRLKRSDMYEALPKKLEKSVHVITGHVPYVRADEMDDLPAEVREYEPIETLMDASSDDGMGLMRRAVEEAPRWLTKGGWLLLEMAEDIAPAVEEMCREMGFDNVGSVSDDDGLSVVVEGRFPR
jgi:release factor glutamine methyltransferase